MNKLKLYSSVYPGSMTLREDGSYVDCEDNPGLTLALLRNIENLNKQVEDWRDSAIASEKLVIELQQKLAEHKAF